MLISSSSSTVCSADSSIVSSVVSSSTVGVVCPCSAIHAALPPGISEHSCNPQISVEEPYFEVPTPLPLIASALSITFTDAAIAAVIIIVVRKSTDRIVLVIEKLTAEGKFKHIIKDEYNIVINF